MLLSLRHAVTHTATSPPFSSAALAVPCASVGPWGAYGGGSLPRYFLVSDSAHPCDHSALWDRGCIGMWSPAYGRAALLLTATASLNSIFSRQQPPPTALATRSNRLPDRFALPSDASLCVTLRVWDPSDP